MRTLITIVLTGISLAAIAQTKTTDAFHKRHDEALSLYFYHNTLRMLNQTDNKDFDDMIKDIEKMKLLLIDKSKETFSDKDYQGLLKGYKSESYEEMLTSRFQGRNFDVYLKEKDGKVKGTIVLVNDSTYLYVLDILGSVALDKVTSLFSMLDQSADIGEKIQNFTSHGDKRRSKVKIETDDN